MIFRALVTWLVLVLIAMIHVRILKDFVVPGMGPMPAYIIGTLIASLAMIGISFVFVSQNELKNIKVKLLVGFTWVLLSLGLYIAEKIMIQQIQLSKILEDFFTLEGLFFGGNLLILLLSPWLASLLVKRWRVG